MLRSLICPIKGSLVTSAIALLAMATACDPSLPPPAASSTTTDSGLQINSGITTLAADQLPPLGTGQLVYVPIYSEIYDFDQSRAFPLTATLSLRNTDANNSLVIETIDYYDTTGTLLKRYLSQPIQLAPLASTVVVIDNRDSTGGSGANFLVAWRAAGEVTPPVFEAVMISTASQQGISFVSSGRVIEER